MKQFIQSILLKIANSVTADNPISSTRVQSYIILFPILIMILVFLVIEMWSFIHAIKNGLPYRLSNEIIVVFGMMLGHHLSILFSRSKSPSIADITGAISKDQTDLNNNTLTIQQPVVDPTVNTTVQTDTTENTGTAKAEM